MNMWSFLDLSGLPSSPRLERALHFVLSVGASGASTSTIAAAADVGSSENRTPVRLCKYASMMSG